MLPGTYRNSDSTATCYWARLSGFGGGLGDIIANDVSDSTQTVTISSTDAGFESNDCGTWTLAPVSGSPSTTFGSGVWIVGVDILPGTYRNSDSTATCYWARLSGFGGGLGDIIANDVSDSTQTVTISSTDAGFESNDCGTWARIGN